MTPGVREPVGSSRQSPEIGFKRYYQTLRERWWLVVACVVITVVVAAAYVAIAPRRYRADAQMLVSPVPATTTTLIGLPVLHATSDPTRDVLTAASLMTTTQVAAAVVNALHISESPGALLGSVTATPIGGSNVVAIDAVGSSAKEAASVANAFAAQVVATRTAALHSAIDTIIPGLRTEAAALPASQRNGPGTIGDQLQQLQQLHSSNDPTISFAAPAQVPTGPYSPRTSLALAAGLFAGLVLGIGAAFALRALDPRLRRVEQLRDLFGLPILATIPREPSGKLGRPLLPAELSFGAQEGYRTLRTMLSSRAGGKPSTVLVTGSSPAEGKTTSAISLAAALAQGGSRVILIEADLRRPTIASTLGLKVEYGTEDVLIGEAELADALVPTRFDGVPARVLAVHQPRPELADRLSIGLAQRLVKQATSLADFVVIDSPPLTAVIDALPLAQLANEVVVVARLGVSSLGRLAELHDLLLESGSHASGILLIGGDSSARGNYYDPQGPGQPSGNRHREPGRFTRGIRVPD